MKKSKKREFFVNTPLGELHIYAKHDTDSAADYPGVYIDLGEDMVACIEFDSSNKNLLAAIYDGNDEPCEIHHYENLGNEVDE